MLLILWLITFIINLISMLVITLVIAALTLIERKFLALNQRRVGPYYVGYRGRLQYIADALKLFIKGVVTCDEANKFWFYAVPSFAGLICYFFWVNSVWCPSVSIFDIEYNLVYASLLSVSFGFCIILLGYFSGNKYTRLASIRAALNMLNLELFLGLMILTCVILTESFCFSVFVLYQEIYWFIITFFGLSGIICIIFLMEVGRTPFDLAEAESELVVGYSTEIGGFTFGIFYLGEYFHLFFFSAVISILFFGGWEAPSLITCNLDFEFFWNFIEHLLDYKYTNVFNLYSYVYKYFIDVLTLDFLVLSHKNSVDCVDLILNNNTTEFGLEFIPPKRQSFIDLIIECSTLASEAIIYYFNNLKESTYYLINLYCLNLTFVCEEQTHIGIEFDIELNIKRSKINIFIDDVNNFILNQIHILLDNSKQLIFNILNSGYLNTVVCSAEPQYVGTEFGTEFVIKRSKFNTFLCSFLDWVLENIFNFFDIFYLNFCDVYNYLYSCLNAIFTINYFEVFFSYKIPLPTFNNIFGTKWVYSDNGFIVDYAFDMKLGQNKINKILFSDWLRKFYKNEYICFIDDFLIENFKDYLTGVDKIDYVLEYLIHEKMQPAWETTKWIYEGVNFNLTFGGNNVMTYVDNVYSGICDYFFVIYSYICFFVSKTPLSMINNILGIEWVYSEKGYIIDYTYNMNLEQNKINEIYFIEWVKKFNKNEYICFIDEFLTGDFKNYLSGIYEIDYVLDYLIVNEVQPTWETLKAIYQSAVYDIIFSKNNITNYIDNACFSVFDYFFDIYYYLCFFSDNLFNLEYIELFFSHKIPLPTFNNIFGTKWVYSDNGFIVDYVFDMKLGQNKINKILFSDWLRKFYKNEYICFIDDFLIENFKDYLTGVDKIDYVLEYLIHEKMQPAWETTKWIYEGVNFNLTFGGNNLMIYVDNVYSGIFHCNSNIIGYLSFYFHKIININYFDLIFTIKLPLPTFHNVLGIQFEYNEQGYIIDYDYDMSIFQNELNQSYFTRWLNDFYKNKYVCYIDNFLMEGYKNYLTGIDQIDYVIDYLISNEIQPTWESLKWIYEGITYDMIFSGNNIINYFDNVFSGIYGFFFDLFNVILEKIFNLVIFDLTIAHYNILDTFLFYILENNTISFDMDFFEKNFSNFS